QATQTHAPRARSAQAAYLVHHHHRLGRVFGDVLHAAGANRGWWSQPELLSVLHQGTDLFVQRDETRNINKLSLRPVGDVAADAEHALHRNVETKLQRRDAAGLVVGHIGHPVDHHPRAVRPTVPVLDAQSVGGVGVVAGPDLIGPAQHAQVRSTAA